MKEQRLTVPVADDAPKDRASSYGSLSRDQACYVIIEAESGGSALEL